MNNIYTAKYYHISQTKLDEMCDIHKIYPIPDYERFFTDINGNLYVIKIENSREFRFIKQKPFKCIKNKNINSYLILNMNNSEEEITNIEIYIRTFYGYINKNCIKLKMPFNGASSIDTLIQHIQEIDGDNLIIDGLQYKRIIYKNELPTNYFISINGIIYNEINHNIIQHKFQYNMYHRCILRINCKSVNFGIHRLVYFVWNDVWLNEQIEINHKDGYKYHNHIDNLEKVTPIENHRHAKILGLREMPYSIEFINSLCALIEKGIYKPKEMQKMLNVPDNKYSAFRNLIKEIISRGLWSDVAANYDFSKYRANPHNGISREIIIDMCEELIAHNNDRTFLYNKYPNIAKSTINAICRGDSHKDITSQYNLSSFTHATKDDIIKTKQMILEGYSDGDIINRLSVKPDTVKSIRKKITG